MPAPHRKRVETYLASKTRSVLKKLMAVVSIIEIICGVICFHPPFGIMTRDRGVETGATLLLKWSMLLNRDCLRHKRGSPESLWFILSPLIPFLWDVIFRVTNIEA